MPIKFSCINSNPETGSTAPVSHWHRAVSGPFLSYRVRPDSNRSIRPHQGILRSRIPGVADAFASAFLTHLAKQNPDTPSRRQAKPLFSSVRLRSAPPTSSPKSSHSSVSYYFAAGSSPNTNALLGAPTGTVQQPDLSVMPLESKGTSELLFFANLSTA